VVFGLGSWVIGCKNCGEVVKHLNNNDRTEGTSFVYLDLSSIRTVDTLISSKRAKIACIGATRKVVRDAEENVSHILAYMLSIAEFYRDRSRVTRHANDKRAVPPQGWYFKTMNNEGTDRAFLLDRKACRKQSLIELPYIGKSELAHTQGISVVPKPFTDEMWSNGQKPVSPGARLE
jgi:hypothetical protein